MDIDPTFVELMQQEIDGCISDEDKERLREFLSRDPRHREEFERLAKTVEIVERTVSLETPPGFTMGVMRSLPRRETPARWAPPARSGAFRRALSSPILRYGYAIAAGLILGLALHPDIWRGLSGLGSTDPNQIAGTMGGRDTGSGHTRGRFPIDLEEVTGSVVLEPGPGGGMIFVDVESGQDLRINVLFEPDRVTITEIGQDANGEAIGDLSLVGGEISWSQRGRQVVRIGYAAEADPTPEFNLHFSIGDEPVHRLGIGGAPPAF